MSFGRKDKFHIYLGCWSLCSFNVYVVFVAWVCVTVAHRLVLGEPGVNDVYIINLQEASKKKEVLIESAQSDSI